jgi:hypothetical protein
MSAEGTNRDHRNIVDDNDAHQLDRIDVGNLVEHIDA